MEWLRWFELLSNYITWTLSGIELLFIINTTPIITIFSRILHFRFRSFCFFNSLFLVCSKSSSVSSTTFS